MKLLDYFSRFLKDTVNLNQSRLDDLDTRVDRITDALKGAADLDGRVLDTVPQGSSGLPMGSSSTPTSCYNSPRTRAGTASQGCIRTLCGRR
jgi:hypothetical protein